MKNIRQAMRRHLLSLVVAGLGLALVPGSANADFLDFTVDETTVPGTGSGFILVVDKINGAYSEVITFDGLGGFDATLVASFTAYLANEGTTDVLSHLSVPPGLVATQYGLYATYVASGTVGGGPGVFTFTTTSADARVFIDPDLDTNRTLPATGGLPPIIVDPATTAADYQVLSASSIFFEDNSLEAGVGGFFDIRFDDPTLTAAGQAYWPSLPLVNLRATVDGDFDDFTVTGTQTISGDFSTVFTIPEPASLALLGLGLFSSGVMARRRQRARSAVV